jgi:hypothetical protein
VSSVEALFHPSFIFAMLCHSVVAPSLIISVFWLLDKINHSAKGSYWAIEFNNWTTQHIWLPLVRIVAILLFIAMSHPVLFGIESATPISTLLDSNRIDTLVNVLFVISVLLPLLPLVGRMHSVILPIQSLAAAQLLFSWMNQHDYHADISLLPSFTTFTLLSALIITSHFVGKWIARHTGQFLDENFNVDGSTDLIFQSVLLLLQGPLLLVYTVELGSQLS